MKQYDKLIIVSCSNSLLMAKLSDALLLTFAGRFKKKLTFYEDVLVFNSAGSFVTRDVISAIKESVSKGENPLVFAYSHVFPKCRGLKLRELKGEILSAFKTRLNWSEKDVASWAEGYGYSLDDLFHANFEPAPLVREQARLISRFGVDFLCGVLNFKTGVLDSVFHNISFSNKERELLKKAIFKQAVTGPKTIIYKKPTYLALGTPGMNTRRILKITKPGLVYPVTVNPNEVDLEALSSIAMFIYIMASDPRVRLAAPVGKMSLLEKWVEQDACIQALYSMGIRKPSFYIRA